MITPVRSQKLNAPADRLYVTADWSGALAYWTNEDESRRNRWQDKNDRDSGENGGIPSKE
jgi:hypothetical protein